MSHKDDSSSTSEVDGEVTPRQKKKLVNIYCPVSPIAIKDSNFTLAQGLIRKIPQDLEKREFICGQDSNPLEFWNPKVPLFDSAKDLKVDDLNPETLIDAICEPYEKTQRLCSQFKKLLNFSLISYPVTVICNKIQRDLDILANFASEVSEAYQQEMLSQIDKLDLK